MTKPRISAVITVYNCAAFVAEAIESVLDQTQPVDEIVVVDDGSTDETAKVVAGYASAGVRYIWQENQGAGAARNRGIQETKGEFIAFLDGDDVWLSNKIANQVAYLQADPDTAVVSGNKWWWDVRRNERKLKRAGVEPPLELEREILIRNVVGNPSMTLIRRRIFDEVGCFNPALRWGQDWELWIRISTRAKIDFVPDPVILYRWHPANLSHDRRWERLSCLFGISRQAIGQSEPVWQRPFLLARAWSQFQSDRAMYAIKRGFPRRQQLWYASSAFLTYPYENFSEKTKTLGRVLVGESFYQRLRSHSRQFNLQQQS